MPRPFLIVLATAGAILAFTPDADAAADADTIKKALSLKPTPLPISVDGSPESAWDAADSTDDFFQLQPYFNQPPTRRTVAKLLTTNDALYCLMVCYAPRDEVEVQKGVVDQSRGDIVSLMIDTFDDKQSAYKFAVTASGVRADCRLIDDARNRDYSWDGVWTAATQVYDWGFVVEMEVPYKSIKYNAALTSWGLDFDRWQARNSEDLYWSAYERNEGQRITKFGRLELNDFHPGATGLNLEVYPVGIAKTTLEESPDQYHTELDAGLDLFYNPSEKLTLQLTANPDFAQIEADPFSFNISRYETYFDERRPFFTQGNEIFMPAGRERNSGFYRPLDLFYSRRIGKVLPDGDVVPLIVGTKAFGKAGEWDYGGFYAYTAEQAYDANGAPAVEQAASFVSGRVKKRIFENSSVGVLFVGKQNETGTFGVIDVDGAFRSPTYQLAYQVARSIDTGKGDFAGSAGFRMSTDHWFTAIRGRYIGKDFEVNQVGYVPWKGTGEFVSLTGPVWNYDLGAIEQIMLYGGLTLSYERVDSYTDVGGLLGLNMGFRRNWGYEINTSMSRSRDVDVEYTYYDMNLSSWFNIDPKWFGNLWGGFAHTYNFSRDWLAFYYWTGFSIGWNALQTLQVGTSYDMFIEGNPDGDLEDITYNARPYVSVTPFNDLNVRVYSDYVFVRSTDRMENIIFGFLVSYNFLPKSWIYFAINDTRNRDETAHMRVADRAGVFKVKYLYYF
jgi:hypothetical protein